MPEPTRTREPEVTRTRTRVPEPTRTREPEITRTRTRVPEPTRTRAPEVTRTSTRVPEPTRTREPEPTRIPTPGDTATPVDTATATPTPTSTATPTPVPPEAGFIADQTAGRWPLAVNFTDVSTGPVESWAWDFGDGETSDEQHPTHVYGYGGSFTVSLTVTGPTGSDTETKVNFIVVDFSGGLG